MTAAYHVEGWPCPTAEAAAILRRIFAGDLTASPGRVLFAPGGAPEPVTTRMCTVCDERPADERKTTCRRCRQAAVVEKIKRGGVVATNSSAAAPENVPDDPPQPAQRAPAQDVPPARTPRLPKRAARTRVDPLSRPLLPPAVSSRMAGGRRHHFADIVVGDRQSIEWAAWWLGIGQLWLDDWAARFPEWWERIQAESAAGSQDADQRYEVPA